MAKVSKRQAQLALQGGAILMVTHGEVGRGSASSGSSYSLTDGRGIALRTAQALLQNELDKEDMGENCPRADLFLIANDDGLFPGFTQTWRSM